MGKNQFSYISYIDDILLQHSYMSLSKQHCVPCRGDEAPMSKDEIATYHSQVTDWQLDDVNQIPQLRREFELKNFIEAVDFINEIAKIAEEEQHHPNLCLHSYKKLKIEIYTHKTKGLHVNDFILASKIDLLWQSRSTD